MPKPFDAGLNVLTAGPADAWGAFWCPRVGVPLGPLVPLDTDLATTSQADRLWRVDERGGRFRLIEVPKPRLKALQRRLLHESSTASRPTRRPTASAPGRSVRTFVEPHAGRATVWRVDLKDFFPSIPPSRVHAIFRTAGYPAPVCRVLTGLCTTSLPADVPRPAPDAPVEPYRSRHLPQGAPTSPALANLAAYRLDLRLNSWAVASGVAYTRYADDLAFSADLHRRFRATVWQIILGTGFRPNAAKSRWMTRAGRQHLGGVVVNVRPNVGRAEYDELKATLTNCVRHGPAGQNRTGVSDFRAHLLGRVAYVASLNPGRGLKLRELLARIEWGA